MDKKPESYEIMYAELESIIQSLQSGELSLDESIKQYERSRELITKLEKHLETAQNKITKIKNNLK